MMQQNPMEYFRIFFRRKWFLIIPSFVGLILGVSLAIILPKQYKSSTKIQIMEGKTDNPLFDQLTVSSSIAQRAKVVREKMLSWNSLVEVIKRLNLDVKVKSPREFEELVEYLSREIKFQLRESNIIEVSYIGMDPVQVQAVVQSVTQIFIEGNLSAQSKETSDAIKFIEEQLRVYRGKIKSSEIAKYNDQLRDLLTDSTEMHPQVKQLRDQINQRMAELKKENLEYSEDARMSAESTNQMLSEIKKALNTVDKKSPGGAETDPANGDEGVFKVMLIDKMDDVMARDVDVNTSIYNSLLQRLETAKITQRLQASKEGTRYIILDPPRIPLKPTKPNPILNTFLGLFFGIVIGGVFVFVSEVFDKSFLDVQEAKEFFGAPLLGAISKITTAEIVEEQRQRQVWFIFWMGSAGILAVVLSVMVAAIIRG